MIDNLLDSPCLILFHPLFLHAYYQTRHFSLWQLFRRLQGQATPSVHGSISPPGNEWWALGRNRNPTRRPYFPTRLHFSVASKLCVRHVWPFWNIWQHLWWITQTAKKLYAGSCWHMKELQCLRLMFLSHSWQTCFLHARHPGCADLAEASWPCN